MLKMRRALVQLCVLEISILLLPFLNEVEGDTSLPVGIKTRYKNYLTIFNNARTHGNTAQENTLNETRARLLDKFNTFGLTTTFQHFSSNKTNTGSFANGANVIAVLKGKRFNTSQDRAVVFVANMDTHGGLSYGVNNDGSGLTAMLTLAEDMTGTSCKRENSIVFAALDFSEIDTRGTYCPSSCGAEVFINSMEEFIGSGQIQLVFVLKCILNFDWMDQSQSYNDAFKTYFEQIYEKQGLIYKNKGNFLAAVGRNDEADLLTKFKSEFGKQAPAVNDEYVVHKFQYNFTGSSIDNDMVQTFPPNDSYTMYLNFWKKNIKAILLTDTCYARGRNDYMHKCPSLPECDTIDKVYNDRVGLLYTVIVTLRNMTEQLAGGSCGDVDECTNGSANCSANATCTNTIGNYSCVCKSGFSGDGKTCTPRESSGTLNQASAFLVQILAFSLALLLSASRV